MEKNLENYVIISRSKSEILKKNSIFILKLTILNLYLRYI